MKRSVFTLGAGLMAAVILSSSAFAADSWKIDATHSSVEFAVRHFVGKARGRFDKFEGSVLMDPKDPSKASINVQIQTGSIDTNDEGRDKHLVGSDFFSAEEFPTITFVSTGVTPKDETTGTLLGNLTMRGVTKAVELKYEILGIGPDAWGNERAGFEVTGSINRKDFGVNWNKTLEAGGLAVGEEVSLMINIEAVKEKPEAEKKG